MLTKDNVLLLILVPLLGLLIWRIRRTMRWPVAEGTVVAASKYEAPSGRNTKTVLMVSYSFHVNGSYYGGSEEVWPPDESFRSWVGARVQVRYDPNNPDSSILLSTPSETRRAPTVETGPAQERAFEAGATRERVQRRISRARSLPKFLIAPVIFWAGAVVIYNFRSRVPPGLLVWPIMPVFLLFFLIRLWPGPYINGIERVYPKLLQARLIWKTSLWLWLLGFPVPAIVIFVMRPGTFGLVCRIFWWGVTHRVVPYPY